MLQNRESEGPSEVTTEREDTALALKGRDLLVAVQGLLVRARSNARDRYKERPDDS